jgi:pro-kumamolisin-like protein/Big-like domain-containing protein
MDATGGFSSKGNWLRVLQRVTTIILVAVLTAEWTLPASAATRPEPRPDLLSSIRLTGHVLEALQRATPVAARPGADAEPLTLTVTLKRADQAGFDRYLHDVYDPQSPTFRQFLSQSQIAARFGPTKRAYSKVLAYLKQSGFTLVEGSSNRLTLTVRGTRAQAERAFNLAVDDYQLGTRSFYANDRDPLLPASISHDVQAITGLTNAGAPTAPLNQPVPVLNDACNLLTDLQLITLLLAFSSGPLTLSATLTLVAWFLTPNIVIGGGAVLFIGSLVSAYCFGYTLGQLGGGHFFGSKRASTQADSAVLGVKATALTNSQKIGLLEFDTFHPSDVQDWLALTGADPSVASRLSQVAVNGGVGSPGAGETEVLLDITTVMLLDQSLNTSYVVYHAPSSTSWQQILNAMINDGVTVISNSWSDCEDQHTLADVQSIDTVLAAAAASGVSVFNGSGDTGATCLDGSPNTVGVPASSPRATAVGGTTPLAGQGITYGGEIWWDGSAKLPPTGKGGFGASRFFARPGYQDGLTASPMRSVPDVAIVADPRAGLGLCQADAGGCPDGLMHGGTSMSAPGMAIMMANLNESLGANLGEVNPIIYPLAATNAFHSPASMGTDFAHVGLGSPRFNYLRLLLGQQTIGPVDPSLSIVGSGGTAPADGVTAGLIQVALVDSNGYPVSGKNVVLTPNAGSHVVISPPSGPSDVDRGAVVFHITDTTIEDVTFTATDATDGVTLVQTAKLSFVSPPAAAGSISASPNVVPADGSSTTTITVTLQDAKGNPTPGKLVDLSQGTGHSIVTAPSPAVTNANGQIAFTATDNVGETVTYTAVDVTDGNLPVPGSAPVTYTGAGSSCVTSPPTAAAGFALTPFANGFAAQNFFFSNVNWGGCPGASNPAFNSAGDVYVSDFFNGKLYQLGPSGGAASSADTLATIGQTLGQPAFGKDGNLYVTRGATGSGFSSGVVLRVDPDTGAVLQTLATGLTCPSPVTVDPLSGDLFFTDSCFGAGSDNPSLWRIENPASANPTLVVYATLPSTPNGAIAFAPNGTMYVVNNYTGAGNVIQVAGTNTPSPPAMTTLSGISSDFWITMGQVQSNGAAKSLLVHSNNALKLVDITTNPFTTTVLANGAIATGTIGPDGCLYAGASDTIFRLAPSAGPCSFVPTNPAPSLDLSPINVSPNPLQGTSTTFTATLRNVSQPQGTPITFVVGGANPRVKMIRADSNGQATFSYSGVFTGTDKIGATTTLGSDSLTSNSAQVTWVAGRHTTFLTLNPSPTVGTVGQPVTVASSLTDISSIPAAPIANANVTFTLGNSSCAGVTDATGLASCTVIPNTAGLLRLTAAFPGTANYLASTASVAFNALGPVAPPPPPPQNKCPLAQGFWKNHPSAWPVTSLTLGNQSYTETELLTILRAPVGRHAQSDASMILADALISAKLDIANGSDPTPVTAAIADADRLLSGLSGKLPYHVKVSSTTGQAMVHDAGVLAQYDDGKLTPNCIH